jgi:tetratricopeptide (TPR) repeat protein
MPHTINGIGTRYVGQRNVHTRAGVCPHCHRSLSLLSYDTRLWFVVVFIPIIPLGRKRIIDYCPACRRHYVANWQKWETARQLDISAALEKYRADPTPEKAIEVHRMLLTYGQAAEAADFQKMVAEKFADNAKVQAYLGQALTQFGRGAEAGPFFARALELRPDMPEARMGVADAEIRAGRLDEARRLLDFLEKPGASQLHPLASLERLAKAYQARGRHQEALTLFRRLLDELPAVGQHPGFRKMVQVSEKALQTETSILPKAKFSLRRFLGRDYGGSRLAVSRGLLITLGGAALVIVAGLAIANEHIRRHRTLYVVNALGGPVQLELAGMAPVPLKRGVSEVPLAEGHYEGRLSGAVQEPVVLDIRCGYFHRWFDKRAWVLNPGEAAILSVENAIYSSDHRPSTMNYYFGHTVEVFPSITHPFTDLPTSVEVQSSSDVRTLTRLDWYTGTPRDAFYALDEARRTKEALRLAEWDLTMDPDDKAMLLDYAEHLKRIEDVARGEAYLRQGLTNRPVRVEWHRTYQELARLNGGQENLVRDYDTMLRAEPDNSSLLYLRGRLCEHIADGSEYFEKSRRADTNNPYPLYALAYNLANAGDWESARSLLDRVIGLRPDDVQFQGEWRTVCMALGDLQSPEKLFRQRLKTAPTDYASALALCETLAAGGRRADCELVARQFAEAVDARDPDSGTELETILREQYLYALGDFPGVETAAKADQREGTAKLAMFWVRIEQNRFNDPGESYSTNDVREPVALMAICLASRLAGRTADEGQWRSALVAALRENRGEYARAADLLDGTVPTTEAALGDIAIPARMKAALAANLALIHPEMKDTLNAIARKFNVDRAFPYYLLRRAAANSP